MQISNEASAPDGRRMLVSISVTGQANRRLTQVQDRFHGGPILGHLVQLVTDFLHPRQYAADRGRDCCRVYEREHVVGKT